MFSRDIESKILENIENDKIILVLWARQVGKTTVLKKIRKEIEEKWGETFFFNLERGEFLESFDKSPSNLFDFIGKTTGKKYIFIDEVQYLKNPTNFLKYLFDEYKWDIKLIVSGSSSFYIDKNFKDSLAGRKVLLEMYPLNFYEFLHFRGYDNFVQILQKWTEQMSLLYKKDIFSLYHEFMVYGGYPDVVLAPTLQKKKEYLEELALSYIKKDIFEAKIEYQEKYFFLLKILANQIGNLLNLHEIANTINLSVSTVENYVYIMRKSYHIVTIKPFFSNMRKELTKMPKVYFYDTGLRNYFINNFESFDERLDKWALLENLVFKNLTREYRVDDIRFWRTQNKNEVDFIVGEKHAIEVKANIQSFDPRKYALFVQNYPDIPLECVDLEKSLNILNLKNS